MPNAMTTSRITRACRAMSYPLPDGSWALWILRCSGGAMHVLCVLLVFLADVLHQLFVRPQASGERQREGLRIIARIDDRHLVLESSQILARVALDGVQLLGMRMTAEI